MDPVATSSAGLVTHPEHPGIQRGAVLGAYRLVTELGTGGMGSVWFAEHVEIGRRAAIKVLHPHVAEHPELVRRFVAEARAVNAIRHPNIVEVTDFGHQDGIHFLVMELLEGETLGERLESRAPLDIADAVRVAAEICTALAAAHERGIVHRDLKPENVFLAVHRDVPERVKLLDFGIAKLLDAPETGTTRTGLVMGTPRYMSPEQCLGETSVDHRTDLYSLGVVLYEMLTGTAPFVGDTFGRLVVAHTSEAPEPVRTRRTEVPRALSDAVQRALAKRPEERHESALAFRDAIEAAIDPARDPSEPPPLPVVSVRVEQRQSREVGGRLVDIVEKRLRDDRLRLPSLPSTVLEALEELQKPECRFGEVAARIERDPLVTARILRVANSPLYGGRVQIGSVLDAVRRLGTRPLRSLLLSLSARQVFQSRDPRVRDAFSRLWRHCVAVGVLARAFAPSTPGLEGDAAYLAGLLHDIGKPVVGAFLLETERQLLEELGQPWMSPTLFARTIEASHKRVGTYLAVRWDLPEPVVAAIGEGDRLDPSRPRRYGNLVCYCDALATLEGFGAEEGDHADTAAVTALDGRNLLGLDEQTEREVVATLPDRVAALTAG